MYSYVINNKGQVTIPHQIRQQLKLHLGDKVGFRIEDNRLVLFRKINDISAAFGLCHSKRSVSLKKMEAAIKNCNSLNK